MKNKRKLTEEAGEKGGSSCRSAEARLAAVAAEARACVLCRDVLPLGARPAFQLHAAARILIVGQAPGTKVHASGRPFTDPSGDRLRDWLGVTKAEFYDSRRFAILPAGLCYPGVLPRGGDRPPDPRCAPRWRPRIVSLLGEVRLVVPVGQYGHAVTLGRARERSVTATVAAWRRYLPDVLPAPHPSWRVNGWLKRNPWFEAEVLPELRRRVRDALSDA